MYQSDFDYLVTKVTVEYSSTKKKIIDKKNQINIKQDQVTLKRMQAKTAFLQKLKKQHVERCDGKDGDCGEHKMIDEKIKKA